MNKEEFDFFNAITEDDIDVLCKDTFLVHRGTLNVSGKYVTKDWLPADNPPFLGKPSRK